MRSRPMRSSKPSGILLQDPARPCDPRPRIAGGTCFPWPRSPRTQKRRVHRRTRAGRPRQKKEPRAGGYLLNLRAGAIAPKHRPDAGSSRVLTRLLPQHPAVMAARGYGDRSPTQQMRRRPVHRLRGHGRCVEGTAPDPRQGVSREPLRRPAWEGVEGAHAPTQLATTQASEQRPRPMGEGEEASPWLQRDIAPRYRPRRACRVAATYLRAPSGTARDHCRICRLRSKAVRPVDHDLGHGALGRGARRSARADTENHATPALP